MRSGEKNGLSGLKIKKTQHFNMKEVILLLPAY